MTHRPGKYFDNSQQLDAVPPLNMDDVHKAAKVLIAFGMSIEGIDHQLVQAGRDDVDHLRPEDQWELARAQDIAWEVSKMLGYAQTAPRNPIKRSKA